LHHRFRYPSVFVGVDVDRIGELSEKSFLFGFNRWKWLSIRAGDFLGGLRSDASFRERLEQWLPGISDSDERVYLFTTPRVLGYVFNPISLFVCLNEAGIPVRALAEVRNTYGEAHLYPLTFSQDLCATSEKEFFVSPFFGVDGRYEFELTSPGERFRLVVRYFQNDELSFVAEWVAAGCPFTDFNLLKTWVKNPGAAILAYPRIVWQALFLQFAKKLLPRMKPWPTHPRTVLKKLHRRSP
jgi:DUF1365 family protein